MKELHRLVKDDDELQELAADPDDMATLREKYDAYQDDKKVTAIRVSKTGQAKMVAARVNEFQQQVCFFTYHRLIGKLHA